MGAERGLVIGVLGKLRASGEEGADGREKED